ncbi:unnamed protein product [Cyprideis torosa]|uniref:UDP-glucose 4-epimerase n=1 Tax=Cyprideis torosa TaxID=163714 RepID=A0A7R8WL33_9CRUS|nr:unnamed protein product [Cyprideis torosa]CAG0901144.1 unnamed protein product [Cyprideis torosa]
MGTGKMKILVTGGAGYIGSHTCLELLQDGHRVVVVDNLVNSSEISLERVRELSGCELAFEQVDLLDWKEMDRVFTVHGPFDGVIHFAGLKAVGESVENPLLYYKNNIGATLTLCAVMQRHGLKKIIFSSSATVYGDPEHVPIDESASLSCTNPYGRTKLMSEEILKDLVTSDPEWKIVLLRYFNPGYSVLDMVHAFAKVSGKPIPYVITQRRPGDIAICYANAELALKELGWRAELGLEEMCSSAWEWQRKNPQGYRS